MDCLIVDDDEMSRTLVRQLVQQASQLTVVGESKDAMEAVNFLKQQPVDILFLDVNLPDMTGYDLLDTLVDKPYVIMITGSKEHAIRAFDLGAVDYLVKPITLPRFLQAVKRVEELKAEKALPDNATDIFVRSEGRVVRLDLESMLYVEALADYIIIYTADGNKHIVHSTMKGFQDRLPEKRFSRIHRSYIINIRKIDTIENQYVLIQGRSLPIGASYKDSFNSKLNLL
jgi:DNA-binding LytR/AlgR family response regulator